jgi:hypothetical protein
MKTCKTESIGRLLADFHTERAATWRPEDLRKNLERRQLLVDTEEAGADVQIGDFIQSFIVPRMGGDIIELD